MTRIMRLLIELQSSFVPSMTIQGYPGNSEHEEDQPGSLPEPELQDEKDRNCYMSARDHCGDRGRGGDSDKHNN